MINKKLFIEVDGDNITYKTREGKKIVDKYFEFNTIKVDMRNRDLYVIVHGEEVYIRIITVPKVENNKLYFIIRQELIYMFKNIDNLMFNYSIYKDNGANLDVIVFCMNWNKDKLLKECIKMGAKLKGVFPVQFYMLNLIKDKIKSKNYIFTFLCGCTLYFVRCKNCKILENNMVRKFNIDEFEEQLDEFIIKFDDIGQKDKLDIFFLNFPYEILIKKLSQNCAYNNLKSFNLSEEEVMEYK